MLMCPSCGGVTLFYNTLCDTCYAKESEPAKASEANRVYQRDLSQHGAEYAQAMTDYYAHYDELGAHGTKRRDTHDKDVA